jgi:polyphosphate kinase
MIFFCVSRHSHRAAVTLPVSEVPMARTSLGDPQHFLNRHFSWLQFNQRVLEEARDPANPVLERVKFLAITASNLDEFVEVRVTGILQQVEHGNREPGPDGRTPEDVLAELSTQIHAFVRSQYDCWQDELVPALAAESIRVLSLAELRPAARPPLKLSTPRPQSPKSA